MGAFDEEGISFTPRGKKDLLKDLDICLGVSLGEFHEMKEKPRINLVRTLEGKLLLSNQITIMEALKYIMTEMRSVIKEDIGS